MYIQRLFIYPIKSLLPVEVSSAEITSTGFRHDRQYILVKDPATRSEKKQSILDDDQDTSPSAPVLAEHLTIKTLSKLCLFQPSIDLGSLTLTVRHNISGEGLTVPLEPAAEFLSGANRFEVEIFGTRALGLDLGNEAATFFSKHLSQPARLLYIGQNSNGLLGREIPAPSLVPRKQRAISWLHGEEIHDQKIQFADAAPLLLTTTASEHDARSRLPGSDDEATSEDIILRFRSNIHIDNSVAGTSDGIEQSAPYAEDRWKTVMLATDKSRVRLDLVFNTVRCMSLNVDFETGGVVPPERQLYKLLAKNRRVNHSFPYKPCFGRYPFAEPFGVTMRVGDEVVVEEMV